MGRFLNITSMGGDLVAVFDDNGEESPFNESSLRTRIKNLQASGVSTTVEDAGLAELLRAKAKCRGKNSSSI